MQERVLAVRKRVWVEEHPATLSAANNLAFTCHEQGKFAEAAELQVQVLAASKRVKGKDHPETLGAARNLAITQRHVDRQRQQGQHTGGHAPTL